MSRYHVIRAPGGALDGPTVDALWTFMCTHVERERAEFEATLAGCREVTVIRDTEGGAVLGLVAAWLERALTPGGTRTAVFVQWMHLSRALRGSLWSVAPLARLMGRALLRRPGRIPYLLFAAATWPAYLGLARVVEEGWPFRGRPAGEAPVVADAVLGRLYPARWDGAAGVLRGHADWRYREGIQAEGEPPPNDPDIRHYVERNPNQRAGDCLAVCAPMSLRNWLAFARRGLLRRLRVVRRPRLSPAGRPS